MKLVTLLILCCGLAPAQIRRRAVNTSKPPDVTGQMVVTFHGKLREMDKKEMTIETEDHPDFVIERGRQTKFVQDGKPIKAELIPVGAVLTVDVKKDPDLHPIAVLVTVDPPAPKPPVQK